MTTVSAMLAIGVSFVLTITFPSNISKYADEENRDKLNGKLAFRLTSEEKWSPREYFVLQSNEQKGPRCFVIL